MRLDGARAAQVWPVFNLLSRDVLAHTPISGPPLFGTLKAITPLVSSISQHKAFEDKRFRREVQELFLKVLDGCILIAGRAPEASLFGRRAARDVDDGQEAEQNEENMVASLADLSEAALAEKMVLYIADHSILALRQLAIDADRLQSICTNAVYYVLGPALRTKSKNFDVNLSSLSLLKQICALPQSLKTWRSMVHDAFNDPRFFKMSLAAAEKWTGIVWQLFSLDKERLSDTIGELEVESPSMLIMLIPALYSARGHDGVSEHLHQS